MTLTFDTHFTSLTHLASASSNFEIQGCNSFKKKINNFQFSHTKAYVTKFDLGVKWIKDNPGS